MKQGKPKGTWQTPTLECAQEVNFRERYTQHQKKTPRWRKDEACIRTQVHVGGHWEAEVSICPEDSGDYPEYFRGVAWGDTEDDAVRDATQKAVRKMRLALE